MSPSVSNLHLPRVAISCFVSQSDVLSARSVLAGGWPQKAVAQAGKLRPALPELSWRLPDDRPLCGQTASPFLKQPRATSLCLLHLLYKNLL